MNNNANLPGEGTSQSPLVQPAAPKPLTPEQKAKQTKSVIGAIAAIVICGAILIAFNVFSKKSTEKTIDEVLSICKDKGTHSTECENAQKEKGVSCEAQGLKFVCTKGYKIYY